MFAETMTLLAQGARQAPPPGPAAQAGVLSMCGAMSVFFIVLPILGVLILIAQIFFLLAMSKALNNCKQRNRTMEPGSVWLSFIPVVGIYFFVVMLFQVPESLAKEFRYRGFKGDGDFGKNMALWATISYFLCFPVGLVMLFMYWKKIAGYTAILEKKSRARDDDDEEDDYEEEEERPRRKPIKKRRPRDDEDEE